MVDPHRPPDRRAPDGMVCNRHPDRPALAACPVCGRGACIVCWHDGFDRCDTCLQHDPTAVAPPVPWENPDGGTPARRLVDTLVTAVRPTATAPAFAQPELAPALRFAAVTAVPLALLRGIIPYTHTLRFGNYFGVVPIGSPSSTEIAGDVLRASGLGLLVFVVAWVTLTLPYVSLARAYGTSLAREATLRMMLYRAWLPAIGGLSVGPEPAFGLLFSFAAWAFPPDPSGVAILTVQLIDTVVPLMLLLFAMRATARFAAGTGALVSFVVIVLPFALMFVAEGLLLDVLGPWLPSSRGAG